MLIRAQKQLERKWMAVSKHKHENLNLVFANHAEEEETYSLTTIEIKKAQIKYQELKIYYKKNVKHQKKMFIFNLLKTQKCYAKMTN
jgi:hypothetical protein